jgi:hypothetical protein
MLAHLGYRKTLHYIRESFWWPNIAKDVRNFCETCNMCATAKAKTQKLEGLVRTLPIPDRPWQSMGMDFMGPLKELTNRDGKFDMIAVAIDHLTAMVHIMPCRQLYKARETAEMVFNCIYKHHGLPDHIVSDRDRIFNLDFWSILHKLMGTELRFLTAYHPETDGATERANRTIMQMLRQCVNEEQNDWVGKLPAIEYAMNLARSDITGYTPFFLNTGCTAKPMIFDIPDKEFKGIKIFAQTVKDAIMDGHDAILTARVKQMTFANRKRRPAPFKLHDMVYLSTENLTLLKGTACKLVPKFIGLFRIDKVVVPDTSFRLELLPKLKRRGVHNVFHAKLLRVHHPNNVRRFPGRPASIVTGNGQESSE